ncbi:inverse autotransporter beta domain-containing protein [Escherichia coli]
MKPARPMAGMYAQKAGDPPGRTLAVNWLDEQYYGDEVALFDKDDRQSKIHAITADSTIPPSR